MTNSKEQIAQALMQAQAVAPPTSPQQQNPYLLNHPLEAAAQSQGQRPPLHPIVSAIMQRLGLMNVIRNRGNAGVVDPETPLQ